MGTLISPSHLLTLLPPSPPSRILCRFDDGTKSLFRKASYLFHLSNRGFFKKISGRYTPFVVKTHLNGSSLVSPKDDWGIWTALLSISTFGLWSEKTKIGSMVSAALVSILMGLAASNVAIIPYDAPAYSVVFQYLLPLTIPMLLFRADLRQVIRSTGTLLLAFLLGSVATIIGTIVAFLMVPMRSLGQDNWKIAAALTGSYIGGAINYVAISEALNTSPSVIAAGVAADNIVSALYFVVLFALASKIPSESPKVSDDDPYSPISTDSKLSVLQIATAVAISFFICKIATCFTKLLGFQGSNLPMITTIVVVLATLLPRYFLYLAPAGDTLSVILMQIFFAVLGASGSIWNVINTAPSIFLFAFVQVTVHLMVIYTLGKIFGIHLKLLLIASNANIGGPTTAGGMATAKGWGSLVVPGILVGIFGISIATFIGIGLGALVLRYM